MRYLRSDVGAEGPLYRGLLPAAHIGAARGYLIEAVFMEGVDVQCAVVAAGRDPYVLWRVHWYLLCLLAVHDGIFCADHRDRTRDPGHAVGRGHHFGVRHRVLRAVRGGVVGVFPHLVATQRVPLGAEMGHFALRLQGTTATGIYGRVQTQQRDWSDGGVLSSCDSKHASTDYLLGGGHLSDRLVRLGGGCHIAASLRERDQYRLRHVLHLGGQRVGDHVLQQHLRHFRREAQRMGKLQNRDRVRKQPHYQDLHLPLY
mmetsp:Transcript_1481/g.2358  ORF Transcript_1481/g.2358 Transcript_1481/m.2358 type:complete len:258 (+) Transcript_1481:746-1519(+)